MVEQNKPRREKKRYLFLIPRWLTSLGLLMGMKCSAHDPEVLGSNQLRQTCDAVFRSKPNKSAMID